MFKHRLIRRFLACLLAAALCASPSPARALRPEPDRSGLEEKLSAAGMEESQVVQANVVQTFNGGLNPTGQPWPLENPTAFSWVTNGLLVLHHGTQVRFLRVGPNDRETLASDYAISRDFGESAPSVITFPGLNPDAFQMLVWSVNGLFAYDLNLKYPAPQVPSISSVLSHKSAVDMKGLGVRRGAVFDPASEQVIFLGSDRGSIQVRGVHHFLWTKLLEDEIAPFKQLVDPITLVEDRARDWIWVVDRRGNRLPQLAAFRWDKQASRYEKVGIVFLPEDWIVQARMAVEPVTGELLITSPYYYEILVLKPVIQKEGGWLIGALKDRVIQLPPLKDRNDFLPIPITVDPVSRRIIVGDPYRRQVWVLKRLSEQLPPRPTVLDVIAKTGMPEPSQNLFWNPVGFRFDGNGQPVVWDVGKKHFLTAEITPEQLRPRSGVPLHGILWKDLVNPQGQQKQFHRIHASGETDGQRMEWDAVVRKEESDTGPRLKLDVRVHHAGLFFKEFDDELVVPENIRDLEGPEERHRGLSRDSDVWLTGRVDPDGSLRLYLLVQDLSGWKPFSWQARLVFQDGRIQMPRERISWHRIDDQHLLGAALDSSGRPWTIRWKLPWSDKKKTDIPVLVPLPTQEERVKAAIERVPAALQLLTAGRSLRTVVVGKSLARQHPGLEILGQFLPPRFFAIDPGGEGTSELIRSLARQIPPVDQVRYHGSRKEHDDFALQAAGSGISAEDAGENPVMRMALEQVLVSLTQRTPQELRQSGVNLQQLADDLELLAEA